MHTLAGLTAYIVAVLGIVGKISGWPTFILAGLWLAFLVSSGLAILGPRPDASVDDTSTLVDLPPPL